MDLAQVKYWRDAGIFSTHSIELRMGTACLAETSAKECVDWLINEVSRLTDTLAAVMTDEWRDAATLPQIGADGRSNDVLGCWPNGEMMVMYYTVCDGWVDSECGVPCATSPAHWQPLPDPPAEAVRP